MKNYHGKEWGKEPTQIVTGTPPSKSNAYRIIRIGNRGGMTKTKQAKDYESDFNRQANEYRNLMMDAEFEFFLNVYYPNRRSDLDGAFKIILDSMQKGINAIRNDNKCIRIVSNKFLDKLNPRIEFKLREYEHPE